MKLQTKNKWEFFYLLSLGMTGTVNGEETTIDNLDLRNWEDTHQFWITNLNKAEIPCGVSLTENIDNLTIMYKHREIVVSSDDVSIVFGYKNPIFDIYDYVGFNIVDNINLLEKVINSDKIIDRLSTIDIKIKHLLIDKLQEMKDYNLENFEHYESDNFLITYDKEIELYEYRTKKNGLCFDVTMFLGSAIIHTQEDKSIILELMKTDKTIEKYLPCSVEMIISEAI